MPHDRHVAFNPSSPFLARRAGVEPQSVVRVSQVLAVCFAVLSAQGCEQTISGERGRTAGGTSRGTSTIEYDVESPRPTPAASELESPAVLNAEHREVLSNDQTLRVRYVLEPAEVPVNEPFSIDVEIVLPDERSDPAVVLSADAAMPHHGHGMNVEPTVTRLGGRRFRVENMVFHMNGRWEIYFDITRDGMTSRAQDELTLP